MKKRKSIPQQQDEALVNAQAEQASKDLDQMIDKWFELFKDIQPRLGSIYASKTHAVHKKAFDTDALFDGLLNEIKLDEKLFDDFQTSKR
jgi:hypothetical protein